MEDEYGYEKTKNIKKKLSDKTTIQMKKNGGYWLGKHRSIETREKISKNNGSRGKAPPNKGKTNIEMYGAKKAIQMRKKFRQNGINTCLKTGKNDTNIERLIENQLLFNNVLYVKQFKYEHGVADFWLP